MNLVPISICALLSLAAVPAAAQLYNIPPGAYRTGAAYHRHQPQPAGLDASYPDKHGQLMVVVPRGAKSAKLRIAPDSVWGYVSAKGRSFRLYRGDEYRLEYADTLCVYSRSANAGNPALGGTNGLTLQYFFSRGLNGLIFPLNVRYLREAYEATNPAFVAAVSKLRLDPSLSDYDKKTGLFWVTKVYHESLAGH